jgi:hypothetical protein
MPDQPKPANAIVAQLMWSQTHDVGFALVAATFSMRSADVL